MANTMLPEDRYLLDLLAALLHGKPSSPPPPAVSAERLAERAGAHHLDAALYLALAPHHPQGAWWQALTKAYHLELIRETNQETEKAQLFDALEAEGIRYLPLKGSVLRDRYPISVIRSMTDLDVLFDVSRAQDVRRVMTENGYTTIAFHHYHHDIYHKEPFINVEMHRVLFDELAGGQSYFDRVWERAVPAEDKNGRQLMTPEDQYIYLLAHMALHFSRGGIGIRSLMDIWVATRRTTPPLNGAYIARELDALGLSVFAGRVEALIRAWFEGAEMDEATTALSAYFLNSGVYGTRQHNEEKDMAVPAGKDSASPLRYAWNRLFLPLPAMKTIYPVLRRCPFLLPACWMARGVRALTVRRKSTAAEWERSRQIQTEDVEKSRRLHELSGQPLEGPVFRGYRLLVSIQ